MNLVPTPPPLVVPPAPQAGQLTHMKAPQPMQGGNLDVWNRPAVMNQDGTYSTTLSKSFGTDQGEVLLPTVVGGKPLSDADAVAHYKNTGEHLGIFPRGATKDADAYAQALHNDQDAYVRANGGPQAFTPEALAARQGQQGQTPPAGGDTDMRPLATTIGKVAMAYTKAGEHDKAAALWKDYQSARVNEIGNHLLMHAANNDFKHFEQLAETVAKVDLKFGQADGGRITVQAGDGPVQTFDSLKDYARDVFNMIQGDPEKTAAAWDARATREQKARLDASTIALNTAHIENLGAQTRETTEMLPLKLQEKRADIALRGAQTAAAGRSNRGGGEGGGPGDKPSMIAGLSRDEAKHYDAVMAGASKYAQNAVREMPMDDPNYEATIRKAKDVYLSNFAKPQERAVLRKVQDSIPKPPPPQADPAAKVAWTNGRPNLGLPIAPPRPPAPPPKPVYRPAPTWTSIGAGIHKHFRPEKAWQVLPPKDAK